MRAALALTLTPALLAQGNQDPSKMDFGPCLAATVTAPWPKDNTALKGLAIRIGAERAATVLFDTELLRVAAAWTDGFLNLNGTPFDGAHGPHPTVKGKMVLGTRARPGVA